ncbi:ATP-binding protein, partial [Streptomyces sp. NPDC002130]|uniref:ATP-binding protein n=2 Tax=Bacteria TaxID=2 RepID=UPI00331847C1
MRDGVHKLRRLAEDVIEVARLDTTSEQADIQSVELAQVVRHAISITEVECEVSVHGTPVSYTDARRLERIIANLILNARNHGKSPIRVDVDHSRITVRDQGNGFTQEWLRQGPRRFQTDCVERGSNSGLGLGLTIVVGQAAVIGARIESAVRPSPVFLGVVAIAVIAGVVAWNSTWGSIAGRAGVFVLVVAGWVVTLCLHEFAHAYLAWRHGDTDVEARGYLTLNPLKYSHPMLSIGLPVLFIALGGIGLPGGAVYLRTGMFPPKVQARISLAGPFTNAVAAVILLVVIRTYGSAAEHLTFWAGLSFLAFLQVMATVLNLLPVPGLDGYNALEPYLASNTRHQ